ncbi:hypothetical protein ABZY91_40245, partial [Kitasatospora sp. NPDC002965]
MTPLDPPGRTTRTVPATFLAGPDSPQREPATARRAEPRPPAVPAPANAAPANPAPAPVGAPVAGPEAPTCCAAAASTIRWMPATPVRQMATAWTTSSPT